MKPRVLLVDDELAVLEGCLRVLHTHFEVDIAVGGEQALTLLSANARYAEKRTIPSHVLVLVPALAQMDTQANRDSAMRRR